MTTYLQLLIFVTTGIVLLWLGFSFLIGQLAGNHGGPAVKQDNRLYKQTVSPGAPQTCPVCSSRLNKGDLVRSKAFPSITGAKDRLMHIQGCTYCLEGNMPRHCPVCGATLRDDEFLIARMFDRGRRRSHVHVMGCSRCRRIGRR